MQLGRVSVVIPVYNGGRFIRQAVDSALTQTYGDVEIVAVDDGSTDDSVSILEQYGDRLCVMRQPNCGNVGAVRSAGIERSTGEFVAFLDQDDWWEPTKLAEQVELFNGEAKVGLVHTAVRFIDDATSCEVGPQSPDARPQDLVGDCFEKLLMENGVCNSSVVVRRDVLDRVGLCDPLVAGNTVQDYALWLRVAERSRFAYVDRRLTNFRLHSAQGHKNRRAMLREELGLLNRTWPVNGTNERRRRWRLSKLYDALAVAHLEANEPWKARECFTRAFLVNASVRSGVRGLASFAPMPLLRCVRNSSSIRRRGAKTAGAWLGTTKLAIASAIRHVYRCSTNLPGWPTVLGRLFERQQSGARVATESRMGGVREVLGCVGIGGAIKLVLSRRRLKWLLPSFTGTLQVHGYPFPFHFRHGTTDKYVIGEVLVRRQYECLLNLASVRTIIDAGANIGCTSVYLLNAYPDATVVALEPESGNYDMLSRNLRKYGPRAVPLRYALWSRVGTLGLDRGTFRDGGEWSTRVVELGVTDVDAIKAIDVDTVKATTIPELMRAHRIDYIDILKIDIEEAERTIFREPCLYWLRHVGTIAIELHDLMCEELFRAAVSPLGGIIRRHGELTLWTRGSSA